MHIANLNYCVLVGKKKSRLIKVELHLIPIISPFIVSDSSVILWKLTLEVSFWLRVFKGKIFFPVGPALVHLMKRLYES